MEIILGFVEEKYFLLKFYRLQILKGVPSLGVCELGIMKNWTEAQIEHQGLILIGNRKACALSRTKRQALLLCP